MAVPQTVTYTITRSLTGYGSGDNYVVTDSSAEVDRGTNDSAIVLDTAGSFRIDGQLVLFYNGATFVSAQDITIKLRRTNNTAADIANSEIELASFVLTTFTGSISVAIPAIIYTTQNIGDRIAIFIDVAAAPSAGTLEVSEDSLIATAIEQD
jgi:hypothetical protein